MSATIGELPFQKVWFVLQLLPCWRQVKRWARTASNNLLSVLALCGQAPDAVFAQRHRSSHSGERFHLHQRFLLETRKQADTLTPAQAVTDQARQGLVIDATMP